MNTTTLLWISNSLFKIEKQLESEVVGLGSAVVFVFANSGFVACLRSIHMYGHENAFVIENLCYFETFLHPFYTKTM